jgi:selenocysteine lyase/cysteine desulfurase
VPIEDVIDVAHRNGLPVIVDAAFQCYPKDGFTRYTSKGADLVAYSCKYFGGPNTAGILLGRKTLVDTVALHSFVGQEGGPGGRLFLKAKQGQMHGSVFRGYKMDRSFIAGAVASLEEHLATDYEAIFMKARLKAARMTEGWSRVPGVSTKLYDVGTVPEEPGRISLHLVLDKSPEEVDGMVKALMDGAPSIWASAEGNHLVVNITSFMGLMLAEDRDTETIMERVSEALMG